MAKQSKNRVKIKKKYKTVGRIPLDALHKIQAVMKLPGMVHSIRANTGNTVKHNHKHMEELEAQLEKLGLTKEAYAEFVARNYNEIHEGNKPFSLVIAVANGERQNHMAAVHLHYEKNENFWLVTSVHVIKPEDLADMPLIWKK